MKQLDFFDKMEEVKKPLCAVCGNSFEKKIYNKIYCSIRCNNKKYRDENKEKIKKYRVENKETIKESKKKYYEENNVQIKEKNRKYKDENKERIKEARKKYYEENKEKIKEKGKKYRDENKEKIKEKSKKYTEENKEKIKKYRDENKEKIKEKNNKYIKKRLLIDNEFKLRIRLRNRINSSLKTNRGKKTFDSMTLIGCTIEEAREHLEKQFKEGMSWENHGYNGWHIDHIIPCASFDLTDPEQQKKCFHYTNLQPLWASENLSKGSKILTP